MDKKIGAKLEAIKLTNRNPEIDFEQTQYCLEQAHELLSGAAKYGGLRVDVRDEMHGIAGNSSSGFGLRILRQSMNYYAET